MYDLGVQTSYKFESTSSDPQVKSSDLPVTSSNPQVTSSNPRVTSSNSRVTSSNLRVQICFHCLAHFHFVRAFFCRNV